MRSRAAAPFGLAARALALAVGIEHERDHHRRLVRLPPPTVLAAARVERGEVELADRIEHKPREVVLGQPVAEAGGQQVLLVTLARQEALGRGGAPESLRPPPPCSSYRDATSLGRLCDSLC